MIKDPKIYLIDIETSPILSWTWETYQTNVLKILEPSKILSVAWKQFGDIDVTVKTIADYKGYKPGVIDDKKLITEVWKVLDDADVVIAHHGDAFDIKKLNARFIYHGLNAPSKYQTIDTKKVASKYFKFDSNSLNNLGALFGIGAKVNTGGFDLWVQCIAGDPEAWAHMAEYNAQDVTLLEQIYLKLRPYITNHPNLNVITDRAGDEFACPTCMSHDVQKRGFAVTRTGKKQRYQCSSCGSWSSGPYIKSKNVLVHDD